ncbi:MAG: hypothetical protein NTU58_03965 [Candidatus Nealsonbacteria bacterium]|nr:hypothetical protein [Candidatus Nealsonbacteria bacterium]
MKEKPKERESEEIIETDSLICEKHNQVLIHLNNKLYCNQCKKYFKYRGRAVKVITPANPLREIKVPKKVSENN